MSRVLILSFVALSMAQPASAQAQPMTVSILRRTAVRTAPSASAPTIAIVNPSTFAVTKVEVKGAFVRLLLSQIERGRPAGQFGYIAAEDVAVDSAATDTMHAPADTLARALAATVSPNHRPRAVSAAPAVPARSDSAVPARRATTLETRSDTVRPVATPRVGDIIVRPDAPPPPPSGVDTPELSYLKEGPLTAILQRPLAFRIGNTRDSIVVPAGFVADFASIPRFLWTELSPVGAYARMAIVHDYLYWFQPCEREEADNLLMIAMKEAGVPDLQRGAVYAGVRVAGQAAWDANRAARDRGDLAIVPTQVKPTVLESWTDFRARLGKADIRGTPGRMSRQSYCDYGTSQQVP